MCGNRMREQQLGGVPISNEEQPHIENHRALRRIVAFVMPSLHLHAKSLRKIMMPRARSTHSFIEWAPSVAANELEGFSLVRCH